MSLLLKSIITALVVARGALAVGTPFGYAAGTTGGGKATPASPTSLEQLVSWLGDNVLRVIVLEKTYDFTDYEKSQTGTVCKPWTCSPGAQVAINLNGWCDKEQKNAPKTTATWKKAGLTPINVGSNKTLLGKRRARWIKGKGIRMAGSSNVIIQNVRFSDINAGFVWGGDALTIDGGKNIWIDHNYFKDVGRQFIVTGYGAAQGVTISDNVFDGSEVVHMYNNYFVDIIDHSLDADVGSHVLHEGNYFNRVVRPSIPDRSGIIFAPTSGTMNAQCKASLGRNCTSNTLLGSGELAGAANANAIAYFNNNAVKGASVMDPSKVRAYVQNNAGLGKVN